MSNAINDDKEEEDKKEPLNSEPGEVSKQKILMYYGLTVGGVILIVIIVLIIAIKLGGTPSNEDNSKTFKLKYISEENTKIKLFNSELKDSISSMKIDDKSEKIVEEFTFTSKGEHSVEITLKKDLTTMEKLFKGCTNLTEIDLSKIDSQSVTNMAEMFYDCAKL